MPPRTIRATVRRARSLLLVLGWVIPTLAWGDEPPQRPALAETERWYQVLLDDNLDGGAWSQAAREITRAEPAPTWPDHWLMPEGGINLPAPVLFGEALRGRRKPSVADLFALRLDDLAARDQRSSAVRMAEHLLVWDRNSAASSLRKASRLLREQIDKLGGHENEQRGRLTEKFAQLTLDRVALGDRSAARDYAALIREADPAWFVAQPLAALEPLHRLTDDPDVADAARRMFLDPRSPWRSLWNVPAPLPEAAARGRLDLVTSSLLTLPDLRRAVAAWLSDPADAGTVQARGGSRLAVQTHLGYRGETTRQPPDGGGPLPSAPDPNPVAFRRADLVAWRLANLDGAPRFGLDWPLAQRDEAITALRTYLDRFGPLLVPGEPGRPRLPGERPELAGLEFPILDGPATRADVEQGRAIFTLHGEPGERRVVPLAGRPLAAQWVAYRRPGERAFTPPGSGRIGRVWQAEEVWQDGQWVRFFGFVVDHRMVRLPAAALEFGPGFEAPPDRRFSRSSPTYLVPKGAAIPWASRPQYPPPFPAGAPLPVPICLRNLRGDDLVIPADLVERRDGQAVALAEGLALELTFNPARTTGSNLAARPFDDSKPTSVDLRREVAGRVAYRPSSTVTLGPGATGPTTTVDLRDLYPDRGPGRYVLRVSYTRPGAKQPDAVGQSLALLVGPGVR